MNRITARFLNLASRIRIRKPDDGMLGEFCPRCDANLTLQKGYDNSLPYWKCLGCGEMLINPTLETDSGIVWI